MEIKNFHLVAPALEKKVGNRPCPMCGKLHGFIIDHDEHQDLGFNRTTIGLSVTGEHRYIPCAIAICRNCGYIMKFDIRILLDNPNYLNE